MVVVSAETRARLRSAAHRQWANPTARSRILLGQRAAAERRWRRGLIENNLGLAAWMASRFAYPSLDFDDLRQAALLGLMKAAEKFDPRRGVAFSTLAWWWMRSAIQQEVMGTRTTIRVPAHRPVGDGPRAVSLGTVVGDSTLGSLLVDGNSESPVEGAERSLLSERVRDALETLRPRDAEVVELRFGINGARRPHSLAEIARRFGVTRERVRQIEGRALGRLRFRLSKESHLPAAPSREPC